MVECLRLIGVLCAAPIDVQTTECRKTDNTVQ